mmetsp:Transcript_6456/g.24350  ORF Transcript_6456/g.24350 Transcript_6456/m.24350 type:complete len:361 (-) Transcript_6456:1238-2320(-)
MGSDDARVSRSAAGRDVRVSAFDDDVELTLLSPGASVSLGATSSTNALSDAAISDASPVRHRNGAKRKDSSVFREEYESSPKPITDDSSTNPARDSKRRASRASSRLFSPSDSPIVSPSVSARREAAAAFAEETSSTNVQHTRVTAPDSTSAPRPVGRRASAAARHAFAGVAPTPRERCLPTHIVHSSPPSKFRVSSSARVATARVASHSRSAHSTRPAADAAASATESRAPAPAPATRGGGAPCDRLSEGARMDDTTCSRRVEGGATSATAASAARVSAAASSVPKQGVSPGTTKRSTAHQACSGPPRPFHPTPPIGVCATAASPRFMIPASAHAPVVSQSAFTKPAASKEARHGAGGA